MKNSIIKNVLICILIIQVSGLILLLFCLFRAVPTAYGGSLTRGRIRAIVTGLRHSYSNAGSEPSLPPTPQLMAKPDP